MARKSAFLIVVSFLVFYIGTLIYRNVYAILDYFFAVRDDDSTRHHLPVGGFHVRSYFIVTLIDLFFAVGLILFVTKPSKATFFIYSVIILTLFSILVLVEVRRLTYFGQIHSFTLVAIICIIALALMQLLSSQGFVYKFKVNFKGILGALLASGAIFFSYYIAQNVL